MLYVLILLLDIFAISTNENQKSFEIPEKDESIPAKVLAGKNDTLYGRRCLRRANNINDPQEIDVFLGITKIGRFTYQFTGKRARSTHTNPHAQEICDHLDLSYIPCRRCSHSQHRLCVTSMYAQYIYIYTQRVSFLA